ncbi:MAG: hypothetical protein R6T98_14890 [Desulfatiglandales bacterium]
MKNPAIFTIPKKMMDFFEVTGGLRLVDPPARREGCCLFVTYQWGNPQAPIYRGNVEGAKLPHGYVAEKTNPGAPELKKSPSSLDQEGLCKGLFPSCCDRPFEMPDCQRLKRR